MVHSHVLRFCQIMYCGCVFSNQLDLSACLYCYCVIKMIHDLQSIKHLLLLESKFANNKFTFSFEKQSFPHLFELSCFKMLSIYYYDRKVNTNSCATSISGNVYETWFGQYTRLRSTFCRYIYIYGQNLSKEQNNDVLKIVKMTYEKTLFFSVLSLFSLPPLHVD